jgi:hypothetical protein
MKKANLNPENLIFMFEEQEDIKELNLNIDVNIKTNINKDNIKIINHKKKVFDTSTKLF